MYKCFYCGNPVDREAAVIDHKLPRSHKDYNEAENVVVAHQLCIPVRMGWWAFQWARFKAWLESWQPCPKELGGYTCHHRIMSNGKKECGEERNYWRGDRD